MRKGNVRRLASVLLCFALATTNVPFAAFAEEPATEQATEIQTERKTEKPTEPTPEPKAEKPAEQPQEPATEKQSEPTTEKPTEQEASTEAKEERQSEPSTEDASGEQKAESGEEKPESEKPKPEDVTERPETSAEATDLKAGDSTTIALTIDGGDEIELNRDDPASNLLDALLEVADPTYSGDDPIADLVDGDGARYQIDGESDSVEAVIGTIAAEDESTGIIALYDTTREIGRFTVTYSEDDSTATATKIQNPTLYTITYNANGGELDNPDGVSVRAKNEIISHFDNVASWDEENDDGELVQIKAFNGWFDGPDDDATEIDYDAKVTGNMTLYAHWIDLSGVNVILDENYVRDGETESIKTNLYVDTSLGEDYMFEDPEPRDGFTFMGWAETPDATSGKQTYMITADDEGKTFYAVWFEGEIPTITYDYDKENYVLTVRQTVVGKYETNEYGEADDIPTDYGDSEFLGWYDENGNLVENGTTVDDDITLKAKWADPVVLTFNPGDGQMVDGAETTVDAYTNKPASEFLVELPEAELENCSFFGWFTAPDDGEEFTLDSIIDPAAIDAQNRVIVYARYAAEPITIHFDPNGGELEDPTDADRDLSKGDAIGELPEAEYAEHELEGWYTEADGGTKVTESTVAEDGATYYAHWTDVTYTVTFNGNGGTVNGAQSVKVASGSTVDSLPDAAKDDADFLGWFTGTTDGDEFTTDTQVTGSITVYAHWDSLVKTVTFDPAGGNVTETEREVMQGASIGELPVPTHETMEFDGWYTDRVDGEKISSATTVDGDVTFYAHWKGKKLNLTSVTFNEHELDVNFGDPIGTDVLDYSWTPEEAAERSDFYYTSSNPDVIKISGTQTITYVGGGTTELTVWSIDNSVSDTCVINVTKPAVLVETLAFDEPNQTVEVGQLPNVHFTYEPTNAENASFEMTSSLPNVVYPERTQDGWEAYWGTDAATLTEDVVVTFTVSTTDGTISATETITVKPKKIIEPNPETVYRKVTFQNTGDSTIPETIVEDGQSVNLPLPTKEGYTFDGWHLENGTKIEGSSFTPTSDVVLYGRWTEIPDTTVYRTATFEPNFTGSGAAETRKIPDGMAIGELPSAPTNEGSSFEGWFTAANGGTKITSEFVMNKDETFYAHWAESMQGTKHDLILNPNDGYVDGSGTPKRIAKALTTGGTDSNDVSAYEPEREDYTFLGWYDAQETGLQVYDENGAFVSGGNVWDSDGKYLGTTDLIVYAHWQANPEKKTLTYAPRGGTIDGQASLQEKYEKGTVVTELKTPERDEYDFLGWFTKATGGEQVTSVAMNDDVTIYAQWQKRDPEPPTPEEHTVTFETQGGTPCEPVTAPNGTDVELPETTRDGYDFLGWFTAATGGTKLNKVKVNGDKTVYAQWKEIPPEPTTYQVSFDDGDKVIETVEVEENKTLTKFPTPEVRFGAEFLGWFTERDGGEKVTYYKAVADKTFYAHWKEIVPEPTTEHVLTFDSQGGSAVEPITAESGTRIELPGDRIPTKDGYAFIGWFTNPSGTAMVKALTIRSDVTLYARWLKNKEAATTYVVVLDPRNGDAETTETVDAGTTFAEFPTPVRTGYDFLGWYTEKSGGSQVTSFAGDAGTATTFYAHWRKSSKTEGNLVTKLELNYHDLTVKSGSDLGLSYKYSPQGATNAQFKFSTSDPSIIDTDGTSFTYTGKTGNVIITISTLDGTMSDSCKVKVVSATEKKGGNGVYKGTSGGTNGNGGTSGNGGSGSTGSGGTAGGTSGGTGGTDGASGTSGNPTAEVNRYQLTIVKGDDKKNAAVNATVALEALVKKLGYEAASYKFKTADGTTTDLAGTTTMKELDGKASNGEVMIIAYDAEGKLIGSAKVTKTAVGEFTVNLSKDEDQKLDATPFKTPEGKKEPQKSQVQTGDDLNVGLLVGIGIAVATLVLAGIWLTISDRKKRRLRAR